MSGKEAITIPGKTSLPSWHETMKPQYDINWLKGNWPNDPFPGEDIRKESRRSEDPLFVIGITEFSLANPLYRDANQILS